MFYVQLLLGEIEGGKKKKRGRESGREKKEKRKWGLFSPPGFVRFELTSPFYFFSFIEIHWVYYSLFFKIAHILLIDFSFRPFF